MFAHRTKSRRGLWNQRLQFEHLEQRTLLFAGHGLEFQITPTAAVPPQMLTAFQLAANQWSSTLTDDIVVNVKIDYTASSSGLGQTLPVSTIKSLTEIRDALTADRTSLTDDIAVAHLPSGASAALYTTNFATGAPLYDNNGTDNNTYFSFNRANAKAMGLRAPDDPGLDGTILFLNINSFDYDRSDGIGAGQYDFVGLAMHEIGHLLGFLAGADVVDYKSKPKGPGYSSLANQDNQIVAKPLDLFRFSAASEAAGADFDLRADLYPKYFSIDAGATPLGNFSTGHYNGDGYEVQHWKDNLGLGIMDPTIFPTELVKLSKIDVQALDVIGWNVAMDFGDAPHAAPDAPSYATSVADGGPRHLLFAPSGQANDPLGLPKVFLGTGVEADPNGQPTATADGDDNDGTDDETGVTFPPLVIGATASLPVASSASVAKNATLNYFFDFNRNGVFDDPGEAFSAILNSPAQLVPITIPAGTTPGATYARFRISTAGGLGPTGPADDGEVEDYLVSIIAAPEVAVSGLGLDIKDGDNSPAGSDGTDFGSAIRGSAPVTRTFTVSNQGSETLTLGAVSLPGGFSLGADTLVSSLAPGETDTFTVQLDTPVVGPFVGDVSIVTNDADENPFNFSITGAVIPPSNSPPSIANLVDNPDLVIQGANVTLTAQGVIDPDAVDAVLAVAFYRDTNANATVDPTDPVLGFDYDGSDGWSWTGSTTSFPSGTNRYLARATDGQLWSPAVLAVGTVYPNIAPVVGTLAASPSTTTRPANLTLTASGLSDPGGNGVTSVEFYRDSNASGTLEPAIDQLLGSDANGLDGWSWIGSTLGFDVGSNRYFARAQSLPGLWSAAATKTSVINNALPTMSSLTAGSSVVVWGGVVTLTANSVADADGNVGRVEFYRDLDNNNVINVTDELLGSDVDPAGGWTWSGSTVDFPAGNVKFLARAQDSNGAWSGTRYASSLVNLPPTLDALGFSAPVVHKGDSFTVTAFGVSDPAPGLVSAVEFYRDANANGLVDAGDVSLGSDVTAADGWFKSLSSSTLPLGNIQIVARAKDNNNAYSSAVAGSVWINNKPTLTSLTAAPATVLVGQDVTLTANTVDDVDGTISRVDFYRDLDSNGIIDATDVLLGSDFDGSDGWKWTGSSAGFPVGPVKYLARGVDNNNALSPTRYATGLVNAPPTLGALSFSADTIHKGDYVTVNALGVADQAPGMVTAVEFYRDANANGLIDNGDVSLGSDTTSADGWFKTLSTSTFPLGAVQIIARAKDNNGAYSPLVAGSVWINNKPTIGSVTAAPATVVQSTNVTLTANFASDIDGDIVAMEIYLDLNGNSAIDPDSDRFLGFAIKTAPGVWKLSVSTADFPIGPVKYLFRAKDNRGAWSATKVLVGTVAAP